MCSPRTWGWTCLSSSSSMSAYVFPTHVGMDRPCARHARSRRGVPHARGDGPGTDADPQLPRTCSPRTWGWTALARVDADLAGVFPTHVGMDRFIAKRAAPLPRVPHARGDGPPTSRIAKSRDACSPRTWGWTAIGSDVAPASERVPHARGDGPHAVDSSLDSHLCSPRTWGWTVGLIAAKTRIVVFPTHVGIDRRRKLALLPRRRVPHARGDGPEGMTWLQSVELCSPRTWGWTAS